MRSRFFLRLSGSLLLLLMPTSGWAADYPTVVRGRAENGGGPRTGGFRASDRGLAVPAALELNDLHDA